MCAERKRWSMRRIASLLHDLIPAIVFLYMFGMIVFWTYMYNTNGSIFCQAMAILHVLVFAFLTIAMVIEGIVTNIKNRKYRK